MKTHSGDKPYKCNHCDSAFTQDKDLKMHNLTHTSEKKSEYIEGDNLFSERSYQKTHKMKDNGGKIFQCSQYSKQYSKKK